MAVAVSWGMPPSIARPVFLVPLFMIAAAAASCATPSPLVRLYPSSEDVIWVAGRAALVDEEDGVQVAVSFDHQYGHKLGLRVEVENRTNERIDVDPSTFKFTDCPSMAIESCKHARRVIDPERVLVELDAQESREQADAVNSQAFLGTVVILSAVGDVASAASSHGHRSTGSNTANAIDVMESDAAAHDSELASVGAQQQIWSNEALRRNTLFPGQGTAGRVYIPIDRSAELVYLYVKAGGHTFPFAFQQTITRVSRD
jgi:hypothetical protein